MKWAVEGMEWALEGNTDVKNLPPKPLSHTRPVQEDSSEQLGSVGYRYRTWDLGDGLVLAARCEIDGIINRQGNDQLLTIRTFNQAVLGASDGDWKRKLEHQSAAVLAMELKNNSNRTTRWTLSALLAGCDMMKVQLMYFQVMLSFCSCPETWPLTRRVTDW
jgi:hypothetical protein